MRLYGYKVILSHSLLTLCIFFALFGCKEKSKDVNSMEENTEAERMLQGIWTDDDTEEVTFEIKGDTIFYPDSTSLPTSFKVFGDTLVMGLNKAKYPIVKQAPHLFWFLNQNGDVVKLVKSDDPSDSVAFVHDKPKVQTYNEVVKRDTVITHNGERYHCYIAINPTKYKVIRTTYNNDGVGVDNIYYDNIIHISIYKGAAQIYSRDFRKQMYARFVPKQFLNQSILSDMEFSKADAHGFHFNATICMPDGTSCYMLDTNISFTGNLSMKLLEY